MEYNKYNKNLNVIVLAIVLTYLLKNLLLAIACQYCYVFVNNLPHRHLYCCNVDVVLKTTGD